MRKLSLKVTLITSSFLSIFYKKNMRSDKIEVEMQHILCNLFLHITINTGSY